MQVTGAVLKQVGVVSKLTPCNLRMIEVILLAALTDHPQVRYIRQPHEQVITGMGDGHAHPSGQLDGPFRCTRWSASAMTLPCFPTLWVLTRHASSSLGIPARFSDLQGLRANDLIPSRGRVSK